MKAFLTTALAALAFVAGVSAEEATVAPPPGTTAAPGAATPAPGATTAAPAPGSNSGAAPTTAPANVHPGYHMTPVRTIQARVQSDKPKWNEENKRFVSAFGKNFTDAYRAVMDTVNTASVEGALMYVQAEGIDVSKRSEEQKCYRKNNMTYVVFYDIEFAQTNETLAEYQDKTSLNEYGPMVPMDSGRCTPSKDETLPDVCYTFNGEKGFPNIGPFVGGESKETDDRAPYPNNIWFSFPNTAPTKTWKEKTEADRAATRKGLCDVGVKPNGVDCTFSYTILGFIALDDVIGITSMTNNKTNEPYKNFHEFCMDGGVEFTTAGDGQRLPFWENPLNTSANQERAEKLVAAYQNLTSGSGQSGIINSTDIAQMKPLPSLDELSKGNPPCYKNVQKCNTAGCKREHYAQICVECKSGEDCPKPEAGFKFPTLEKAVGEKPAPEMENSTNSTSGGKGSDAKKSGSKADDKKSAGASLTMQLAGAVACLVAAVLTV